MNWVTWQDTRSIKKSVVFLYIGCEQSGNEIKEIPVTVTPKRMKYLRINLTKEVQNLYTEYSKTLLKEILIMEKHTVFMNRKI